MRPDVLILAASLLLASGLYANTQSTGKDAQRYVAVPGGQIMVLDSTEGTVQLCEGTGTNQGVSRGQKTTLP